MNYFIDNEQNLDSERKIGGGKRPFVLTFVLLLAFLFGNLPQTVYASCGGTTTVANTAQLNAALDEFSNTQAADCSYGITFANDIVLNQDLAGVDRRGKDGQATLSIDGNGYVLDGNDLFLLLRFDKAEVEIDNLTLKQGINHGLFVDERSIVTLKNSTIQLNQTNGVRVEDASSLTIENSLIESNGERGVSIGNDVDETDALVLIRNSTLRYNGLQGLAVREGNAFVRDSTIYGNSDHGIETGRYLGSGYANPAIEGNLVLVNSTVSQNAKSGVRNTVGELRIHNSTIAENGAHGLNISQRAKADSYVYNSVLANNNNNDCRRAERNNTLQISHSLIGTQNRCDATHDEDGNVVGIDAQLGTLADNGGLTLTHALAATSPAVDAGDNAQAVDATDPNNDPLQADQRGGEFVRVVYRTVDMGAYEVQPPFGCDSLRVNNANELEAAFVHYNLLQDFAEACAFEISFGADVLLTADLPALTNTNSNVTLALRGRNYRLDGANQWQTVVSETTLAVDRLTITASGGSGIVNEGTLVVVETAVYDSSQHGIENNGTLTVAASTLANNQQHNLANDGTLVVTNSTLSHSGWNGVNNVNMASATIVNSTISDSNGSGIANYNSGTMALHNSIVANSMSADCAHSAASLDVRHSLVEQPGACAIRDGFGGNRVGVDPMLGALTNNEGPTETYSLLAGSPAINSGDNGLALDAAGVVLTHDQRGGLHVRVQDGVVDMGAFETTTTSCNTHTTYNVTTGAQLNDAINCFNNTAAAGTTTINFSNDLVLTVDTAVILNETASAALVIEGNGFALDGDNVTVPLVVQGAQTAVTLNNVTVQNGPGLGISNQGNITVNDSTVANNNAHGIRTWQSGVTILNNSTIMNNDNGLTINNDGQLTVNNSTITNNGSYGILVNGPNALLTANHATIVTNGHVGIHASKGIAQVTNSLLAGNFLNNANGESMDCSRAGDGRVTTTYSLVVASFQCGLRDGVLEGVDPVLAPLADNGGSTQTYALMAGSPALDTIASGVSNCGSNNTADQRGEARPQGGGCDMGAVEMMVSELGGTAVSSTPPTNLPLILILGGVLLLGMVGVVVRQRQTA